MPAGSLRHEVELQSLAQAPSGTSGLADTFTTFATVWAAAKTRRGLADVSGVETLDAPTHAFTIRFRGDVTREHYLLKGSRRFRIRQVLNVDERGVYEEILAQAL